MLRNAEFNFQVTDALSGEHIISAGGVAFICKAGSPDKETLFNESGAPLANPVSLTRGFARFFVDEEVNAVDVYLLAPTGHFTVVKGMKPSGPNEIMVDARQAHQVMVIPFSIADTAAATATATGITVPANAAIKPWPVVNVATNEAARTITVGVSGTATALLAATSLADAGMVKGALGARLVDTGTPVLDIATAGAELIYTLNASTESAKGFVSLPYYLVA